MTPLHRDLTRLLCLMLLGVTLLAPSAVTAQGRCGVQRWPVKIWADDDAAKVDRVPVPITVAERVKFSRPETSFRCLGAPKELSSSTGASHHNGPAAQIDQFVRSFYRYWAEEDGIDAEDGAVGPRPSVSLSIATRVNLATGAVLAGGDRYLHEHVHPANFHCGVDLALASTAFGVKS